MKNMLKKLYVGLLAVGGATTALADDTISHTFFYVRPHFMSGQPERVSNWRDDLIDATENGWGGMAEAVVYGGKSTNHHKMAEYFMPFGKTCLNVYESDFGIPDQDLNRSKDIEAMNFNIQTVNHNFQSRIKFAPEQTFIGLGLAWKQAFWWCDDHARAWLEVSLPIEHVRNKMGLTETVINDGGGAVTGTGLDGAPFVGTMIDAFKQSNWLYGKIDNKKCLSKTGVADIEIKVNWNSALGSCCRLDSYIGFVAPTGTKINAKNAAYVFSPVIGNNHHWGFLIGGHMAFDVWECGRHNVRMEYDLAARIYAPNHQIRSFDLVDKQWGRYLSVYSSADQAAAAFDTLNLNSGTSGINVFTQCVKVSPRYNADANTALVYNYCNFVAEVGYNLFVREAENVCLSSKWANGEVAVKALPGEGVTNIARTIGKDFNGSDIPFTEFAEATLTRCDLNLDSAAHPAIISNNLYGTLGYQWETCGMPSSFSIGGSYEFSKVNTTMDRWLAWGKLTIAY
jgi:hypothetical protein